MLNFELFTLSHGGRGENRFTDVWQHGYVPQGWVEFLNCMFGNSGSWGWKLQNSCMYTWKYDPHKEQ